MRKAAPGGSCNSDRLPATVLVAARNEVLNLPCCLVSVVRAQRSIVLDSNSTDGTQAIARMHGAELVQFHYTGSYPRKRQWALDSLAIVTPWILLLDADETVPEPLWHEIGRAITPPDAPDAFLITKSFHFLGRRLRQGGFSHAAALLFRKGAARSSECSMTHLTSLPGLIRQSFPQAFQLDRSTEWMPGSVAGHDG